MFAATIFFSAIMLHFMAYLLIVHLAIFTAIFGYIRRSVTSGGCDRAEARGMAGQITTTLEQIYFTVDYLYSVDFVVTNEGSQRRPWKNNKCKNISQYLGKQI